MHSESITSKAKNYLVNHIRLAWRYYSQARKECLTSKTCVSCKRTGQVVRADHINPVGSFVPEENPYIARMFCSIANLQALCDDCHDKKTKLEGKERRKRKS